MGYIQIYHRIAAKGVIKALQKAQRQTEISQEAQIRKGIIEDYKGFGISSTLNAYKIIRARLYNWQKKYRKLGIYVLTKGCRRPKKKRSSQVQIEVKEYIFKYRLLHKGVRKECIKPEVDKYCEENDLRKISVSTIGRIIKELKERGRIESRRQLSLNARSGKIREIRKTVKYKERRKGFKPQKPGDLIQIDSVHIKEEGIKRYFITAIDVLGRQSYVRQYKTLNSKNAKDFIIELQKQYCYEIKGVQTDNGLEFYKHFDQYIKRRKIKHYWNYPRSPKSNAYIERFNRTLREQFIDVYKGDITDIQMVEKDLKDYLFWYNRKKVHQGLNWQTPFDFTNDLLNSLLLS